MNKFRFKNIFYNLWLMLIQYPFSLLYFLAALILILFAAYFFGSSILTGIIPGSDTPFHNVYIDWLAHYYPNIPWWYPLQGGGQSFVAGYYSLPYYFVILLSKLTKLGLYQSFHLVAFAVIPIIAIEIYLYVWVRLKNQTIALLSAIFFMLSSAPWGMITHAGFFPLYVSFIFIVPTILFYELFLDSFLKDGKERLRIIWFIAASLFFGLGVVSHLSVGVTVSMALVLLTFFRTAFSNRSPRAIIKKIFKGAVAFSLVAIAGLLLVSPLFLPVRHYISYVTSANFLPVYGVNVTDQLTIKGIIGMESFRDPISSNYKGMFLFFPIVVLSILGILAAIFKRSKLFALGVISFIFIFYASFTRAISSISYWAQVLVLPTNIRVVMMPMIFLPILAAYGVWSFAYLPGSAVEIMFRLVKMKSGLITASVKRFFWFVAIIVAFLLSVLVIYHYRSYQVRRGDNKAGIEAYQGIGPQNIIFPVCQIPNWQPENSKCKKLKLDFKISSDPRDTLRKSNIDEVVKKLDLNGSTRVDFSPRLGDIVKSFNRHSDSSMLEGFTTYISPIINFLGLKTQVFYEKDGSAYEAEELARWFGTKYLFLNPALDDLNKYKEPDWSNVAKLGDGAQIYRFNEQTSPVSLAQKPLALVIGSIDKDAYEQFFRVAIKGALPFDEAWLVQGQDRIDSYTLPELKKFKLLILHGYSYKNKGNAWRLVDDYVKGGGNVFIDTGWQYVAKDWGKGPDKEGKFSSVELPEPSPVQKTSWGTLPKSWAEVSLDLEDKTISLKGFGETTWQGNILWGASLAEKNDLRYGSKPILTVGDKVIIASRKVGEGEIVWSGMNLIGHALDKRSETEIKLINKLVAEKLPSKTDYLKLTEEKGFPDQKKFILGEDLKNTNILVKESFTPDWKATFVSNGKKTPLKIYRAGPGEMLVIIPKAKSGDEILFEYTLKNYFNLGIIISSLTLLVLVLLFLDSLIFRSAGLSAIKKKLQSFSSPVTRRLQGLKQDVIAPDEE